MTARLGRMRRAFRNGVPLLGWACRTCGAQFPHHHEHRLATFGRFAAHTMWRHGRLPEGNRRFVVVYRAEGRAS